MVTNIKEGKMKKYEQYWPAESGSGQRYGPFIVNVSTMEQHIFADYTIRTIQLVVSKIIGIQYIHCNLTGRSISLAY